MIKKLSLIFCAAIFLFLSCDHLAHPNTSKISTYNLHNPFAASDLWKTPPIAEKEKKELLHILNQKFTYLTRGTQTYVFLSQDGKYVLKFFKQKVIRPRTWLALIPVGFNPYYQEQQERTKIAHDTFLACITAYKELKKETGLLYAHINSETDLNCKVTLVSSKGKTHKIDLDHTCFYVQKRTDLIYPRLTELREKGEVEQAQAVISSIFALIETLGKKGVVENDPVIHQNFGLLSDQAIQIDVGKLKINAENINSLSYKTDVARITYDLKEWIIAHYPVLLPYFEACLQNVAN